jgi:alpha-1,3-mannosyltransferase
MSTVHVVGRFAVSVRAFEDDVRDLPTRQMKSDSAARAMMPGRIFYTAATSARSPAYEAIHQVKLIKILYWEPPRYPASGPDIVRVYPTDLSANFLALTKASHRRRLVASTHGRLFHTCFASSSLEPNRLSEITPMSMRDYASIVAVGQTDDRPFSRIRLSGSFCIENRANIHKLANVASAFPTKAMTCVRRVDAGVRAGRAPFAASTRGRSTQMRRSQFARSAPTHSIRKAVLAAFCLSKSRPRASPYARYRCDWLHAGQRSRRIA